MIDKIKALKKMAQRNFMRGRTGDAQTIANHGVEGMRSNLMNNSQTASVHSVNIPKNPSGNPVSEIFSEEQARVNKSAVTEHSVKHKIEDAPAATLGRNIMDTLNQ